MEILAKAIRDQVECSKAYYLKVYAFIFFSKENSKTIQRRIDFILQK